MSGSVEEVLHFSEDPSITEFVPHVAETASDQQRAYVWAVPPSRAPDYWFPRQCPRAMAWAEPTTTETDRLAILGPAARRVHVIEYDWLDRLRDAELFVYRFPAHDFVPYEPGPNPHAFVARDPVSPLGPAEAVGDLLDLHRRAAVELRCVASIWPWWRAVVRSSLGFSGIRLRHAAPEAEAEPPLLGERP